ncbi:mitotic spindle assembly checkpoint protein MAD2B-like [Actinia tenebrosa]|uniref:Mitotic spindle assembly checkpoint protein MAD2B n=1 Tax=Actinia tenebrosa TaxID=6105 RepID=A0A6P8IYE4_ACTTE|nr:mitotic spindle assembly checkpoint protein MAD2B-like [Actinia tenebrosa]XP_031570850.1 mitotic spindle assembly checkpoint protein MAD2B-like [Actinia tenebrosa]
MDGHDKEPFNAQAISAGVFCDFLEVAFHLILYVREVYPAVVFERRKKYNVPVQMCCHPDLNHYIQDVLVTIKPLIEKNEVSKISLVISNKSFQPVERFTFEIAQPDDISLSDDNLLLHTESALRAFLLKINVCDALLKNNPSECTFTVLAYTKESAHVELQSDSKHEEFPWIPAEQESTSMSDFNIIPLKSMTSPILKMQMYVEENVQKKNNP